MLPARTNPITPEARQAFDAVMAGDRLNGADPAALGAFAGGLQELDRLPEEDRRRYFAQLCDGPDGEQWQALGAAEAIAPPLKVWSADDLLTADFPEPVWAIPDLLPVGLAILAGKPKAGKSWLALQIAQAVASGGRALGYTVQRGPALYLALEDPPRRLQARMKAQGWPAGADADFLTLGEFADLVGNLRGEGGERLALQIAQRCYRLVVIDTLSRAVCGDQNDAEAMTAALTPIHETAHEQEAAILVIDHHRKGFGADADAISDILGSTAKGAMVDTAWGLYRERGKSGATLQIVGRDVEERTVALHFDPLTASWQSDGDAEQLELTANRQAIIEAVGAIDRATLKEIANAVQRNKGSVYRDLADLVGAGAVLKSGSFYSIN